MTTIRVQGTMNALLPLESVTATYPPRDNRGYFMLPLGFEGGGYYAYKEADQGKSHYAHPHLITVLTKIANAWVQLDTRKFGVGDISLAGGPEHPDHGTHRSGLDVDIRPVRRDGARAPCRIQSSEYDRDATAKLIALFVADRMVKTVLFNDSSIPGVRHWSGHDDHFHVTLFGG